MVDGGRSSEWTLMIIKSHDKSLPDIMSAEPHRIHYCGHLMMTLCLHSFNHTPWNRKHSLEHDEAHKYVSMRCNYCYVITEKHMHKCNKITCLQTTESVDVNAYFVFQRFECLKSAWRRRSLGQKEDKKKGSFSVIRL